MRRQTRSWSLWALIAVLSVVLVTGCATIPAAGPVHRIEGERTQDQNAVRYNPPGPGADASPTQVVYGFLDAMLAFPVRDDVAKKFLTDEAAKAWKPRSRTVIYSQPRIGSGPDTGEEDRQKMQLTYAASASLSARGRYAARGDRDRTVTWELVHEHGEWRINTPPEGLMVSEQYFDDYYLPLSLYYFDRAGSRLVADPVYQPEGDQLATTLTTALLRGPEGLLGSEARTYLPKGVDLDVSVPVHDNGTADVRLHGPVRKLSGPDQERLAAQIIWTVRQAHGVSGVRISVDGTPLDLPGVNEVQSVNAWDQFDPAATGGRSQVFALRDGKLVVINGGSISKLDGPWGEKASDIVDFRVDASLRRIAVVPPGRASVAVGSLSDAGDITTVATGRDILRPVWDLQGRLWVIDRLKNSSTLTVVDGKTSYEVPLGDLAGMRITSFELSPDNTRFVAVGEPAGRKNQPAETYVGVVSHGSRGEIDGLSDVRALGLADEGLTSPRSATWRSTVGVVALASLEGGYPQPYVARIDGSNVSGGPLTRQPLLPDIGATSVICSGILAAPVYVSDREHRLWLQDVNGRWQQLSTDALRAPSYPG
ncbi:MAG: LpqB family beta-propeller domain-containing protein [Nocardioidaceae bacterium]